MRFFPPILFCALMLGCSSGYSQFTAPESIVYSGSVSAYFVSDAGAGKILKMSGDGKKVEDYVTGLSQPKGIAISGRSLWVSDVNKLVELDPGSGKVKKEYQVKDAKFLNDVEPDSDGNIYISDTWNNCIYKLAKGGSIVEKMKLKNISAPNGLLYDKSRNRLLVVSYNENATIKSIDLGKNEVSTLLETRLKELDGIQFNATGKKLYFTAWGTKAVYSCDLDSNGRPGEPAVYQSGIDGPADIFFVREKNKLAVPSMNSGKIYFFDVAP